MDRGRDFTYPGGGLKTAYFVGERPKLGLPTTLVRGGGVHGKRPRISSIDQNELGDCSFESPVHGEEESRGGGSRR